MIDALYISATGLRGQQKHIDTISNNVANLQTPGFKKGQVNFVELTKHSAVDAVAAPTQAAAEGAGTRVADIQTDFSTGDIKLTRNPLHVAIDGAGLLADGSLRYSRSGQLKLDSEGFLAAANGLRLSAGIQIPEDASELRIETNGEVSVRLANEIERTVLGQLELAQINNPDALIALGDSQYGLKNEEQMPTLGRPGELGLGLVQQGFLEMSNVDLVDEMTSLVLAQRAYQLNARVLQASDQVLETINNLRR